MLKSSYNRDTEVRIGCFVNKAQVLKLLKKCNEENYYFEDKMTCKKAI